jgi:formylglycine-generating enzyme required for sulfatase activity
LLLFTALPLRAGTFTVSSAADSGPGTLRQAILDLNATATAPPHEINFTTSQVNLASALPVITRDVKITGYYVGSWIPIGGTGAFRLLESTEPLQLSGLTFRNGVSSGGNGGAVLAPEVHVVDCHFENNSALRGGAVSGAIVTAKSTSFLSNQGAMLGGALHVSGTTGNGSFVLNCTFHGNKAGSGSGGAIASAGAPLVVTHCTVTENTASVLGGAFHSDGPATWLLRKSIVTGNEAPGVQFSASMTFEGGNFLAGDPGLVEPRPMLNNSHHRYPVPGSPVVDAVTSFDPVPGPDDSDKDATGAARGASRDLGAIEQRLVVVPPSATTASATGGLNDALSTVHLGTANAIVLPAYTDISIDADQAYVGKPFYVFGGDWSTLDGNNTRPIFTLRGNTVSFHKVRFRNGRATFNDDTLRTIGISGGAIFAFNTSLWVDDCSFIGCDAPDHGGAIYAAGDPVWIRNSYFYGNTAVNGGAISIMDGWATIENVSFHNNTADYGSAIRSGALLTGSSRLELGHLSLSGNTHNVTTGGPIRTNGAIDTNLIHCVVSDNSPNDTVSLDTAGTNLFFDNYFGPGAMLVSGNTDPRGLGYLEPAWGSPVIDAAPATNANDSDQLGRPRFEGGAADLGAVEVYSDDWREWVAPHFTRAQLDDISARAALWGPGGDADGDGFANLGELAFLGEWLDPMVRPVSPTITMLPGPIPQVKFSARKAWGNAFYGLQLHASPDLVDYFPVPSGELIESPDPVDPDVSTWTYTQTAGIAGLPKRFFLPRLISPPPNRPILLQVGLPGNAADTNGKGSVATDYRIGKYEVTNAEYVEFLNTADPEATNGFGLYDLQMTNSSSGGIFIDFAAAPGLRFRCKPGRELHPVNSVSYWSALRYCNWLTNGGGGEATINNGSYMLTGSGHIPDNAATVTREPTARYFLPTFNEWYKAAYFANDNSIGGLGLYAQYPVTANTVNTLAPPGDPQSANLHPGGFSLNFIRAVGSYPSAVSPFGLRDMGGNVREMVEAPFPGSAVIFTPGGSAFDPTLAASKSQSEINGLAPEDRRVDTGFRVGQRP